MKRIAAAIAASLIVAGCGATTVTTTQSPAPTTSSNNVSFTMPADSSGSDCAIQVEGQDAVVAFSSSTQNVASACNAMIQIGAQNDTLWQSISWAAYRSNSEPVVCSLTNTQGSVSAQVLDDGGQYYGQQACTSLLGAGGWVESH